MSVNGDDIDDLPPRRRVAPPRAFWWALIAVAALVAAFLLLRVEPHRVAPAEHNTAVVDRAPVALPAAK